MVMVLVTITTTRIINDPDKYIQMGVSLGWGKRLRWPDDYTLSVQLAYQRYMMKN